MHVFANSNPNRKLCKLFLTLTLVEQPTKQNTVAICLLTSDLTTFLHLTSPPLTSSAEGSRTLPLPISPTPFPVGRACNSWHHLWGRRGIEPWHQRKSFFHGVSWSFSFLIFSTKSKEFLHTKRLFSIKIFRISFIREAMCSWGRQCEML